MADALTIRRFANTDAPAARDLFIRVNRLLAPPQMKDAFETYIASSIAEEIGRIAEYYAARRGSFWVAEDSGRLAGMFGLETAEPGDAMELRRMYVEPELRRQGIARTMLAFAENEPLTTMLPPPCGITSTSSTRHSPAPSRNSCN